MVPHRRALHSALGDRQGGGHYFPGGDGFPGAKADAGISGTAVRVIAAILPLFAVVAYTNLSTAVIIMGIAVIMVFVANPNYKPFFVIAGVMVAAVVIFINMATYRQDRIQAWLDPESTDKGYQTLQGALRHRPPGGSSERAWGRVCRSWDLCRRPRTI